MAVHKVVIVGAGIAGLATAVALKRVGIPALVLERSHELRATGAALTLTPNAWRALDALGVAHKLTSIYTPFQKGSITNVVTGATQRVSYAGTLDREGLEVRSVHRRALLKALAEELPTATIRFSSKLMSIRTETLQDLPVYVVHMDGEQVVKTKVLIGCDGVHSVIAQWLGLSAPVHSGRAAVRGLAIFPEGHGLNHEVQQIIGDGGRGGEWARDPELIQKLPWDLIFKNACKGTVTVAGDAMHPMTPDLGQGGCSALEDAVVLGRNIRNSLLENGKFEQKRVEEGLKKYVKERRWRVSGLIAGAYLSGWIQQESSGWLMKFIREKIFYGLIYNKLADAIHYDCGKLPSASSLENAPE
ncbi:monooxygenase 2-like isoform X5 [Magnolia sinica]|uniref:monooxygenase 2-like isoform X5 n=1 Tax=Magnolia sinica TaxID=86752 RepID=UPI00265959A5|nr:monooxygenase 2-like isoform X5 [Magnolia sinica]